MMDDFGCGYSSLNMLENIPVDVLKLDMRFLRFEEAERKKSATYIRSHRKYGKYVTSPDCC